MQYQRATRPFCKAHNAYDTLAALRYSFATAFEVQQPKQDADQPAAQNNTVSTTPVRHVATRNKRDALRGRQSRSSVKNARPYALFDIRRRTGWALGTRIQFPEAWKKHISIIREQAISVKRELRNSPSFQAQDTTRKVLDYQACIIWPTQFEGSRTASPMPWEVQDPGIGREVSGLNLLSSEIEKFARFIEPTHTERIARKAVVEDLGELLDGIANEMGGRMGHEIFGSEHTGLAVATSDIDIRVFHVDDKAGLKSSNMAGAMELILKRLWKSEKWLSGRLRQTNFPIINVQHKDSGIDVQIIASSSPANQHKAVANLLSEIPNLRELFLVVRTFFDMRGLVDVYSGGLGSYAIFMMLAASLLRTHPTPAWNRLSGAQLRRFFKFYKYLDFSRRGVRASPRPFFQKHPSSSFPEIESHISSCLRRDLPQRAGQWRMSLASPAQPYLFCLQDPADPRNDLGRKSHAIKHVQKTIEFFHNVLRDQVSAVDSPVESKKPKWTNSLLVPIVGECHEVYASRRARIEDFGRAVLAEGRGKSEMPEFK